MLIIGGERTGKVINGEGWLGGTLNTASAGRPNNVYICGGKNGTLRARCDIGKHEELLLDYGKEYMKSLNKRLQQVRRREAVAAAQVGMEGRGVGYVASSRGASTRDDDDELVCGGRGVGGSGVGDSASDGDGSDGDGGVLVQSHLGLRRQRGRGGGRGRGRGGRSGWVAVAADNCGMGRVEAQRRERQERQERRAERDAAGQARYVNGGGLVS